MKNVDEPMWPIVCIYAVLNVAVLLVKAGIWVAAIWTALKPGGSILAAILMVLIGSFIKTKSYSEDAKRMR